MDSQLWGLSFILGCGEECIPVSYTHLTYEAAAEYGALHKVTETVQANGCIVPGQSTRNIEYIAENGGTTRKEQYVHTRRLVADCLGGL